MAGSLCRKTRQNPPKGLTAFVFAKASTEWAMASAPMGSGQRFADKPRMDSTAPAAICRAFS